MNDPGFGALSPSTPGRVVRSWLFHAAVWMVLVCASLPAQVAESTADLTVLSLEALMEIEVPTVYGASKMEQKIAAAPSSVTVITAEEIKRYGYGTLVDVLKSVQGFYVSYDRNYSFVGTRGVNLGDFNARVLLLVNGHRINNNLTDGAYMGTAFILDVDLIDRVEIIRGPGSALYGNNAFFGVINVITRQGKQLDGAEASGEYASFDTYKGRVTVGKQFTNGVQFLFSGTVYGSDGQDRLFYEEFNTPAQNNGVAEGIDGDEFGSFFGSLSYQDFELEGAYNHREKENPTAQYFTTFNDPRLQTVDTRSYATLKYAHSFDAVDVTARLYYDRSEFEIGYPQTIFTKEKDTGEWWGTEVQINRKLWERHVITVGAEYRDDFRQDRLVFEPGTPNVFANVQQDRQSYGVFAQGDFAVLTNLHLNAGVRYDQFGDFDPAFNPRVALIYNPIKTATIKALYGTAFRAPNFLETALSSPGQLEPEEITSYELVYEQEIGRNWRTSISGFYNQMNELIVFENGGFTNFDADAKGMELAVEGLWANGLRGRASYTLQATENHTSNSRLPDSPSHLIKFNVSVPLWKDKVFAGLEYQYMSSRHSLFTTTTGNTVVGVDAEAYGVFNFTLFSRDLVKNLEFSASVYNLFDDKHGDPSSRFHQQDLIEQNGRSFRIKLTYRF